MAASDYIFALRIQVGLIVWGKNRIRQEVVVGHVLRDCRGVTQKWLHETSQQAGRLFAKVTQALRSSNCDHMEGIHDILHILHPHLQTTFSFNIPVFVVETPLHNSCIFFPYVAR